MSKYIEFEQIPYEGKTKRFEVISKLHDTLLGEIKWFGRWRQYAFFPEDETVWNKDCLKDIQDFLQSLMDERKFSGMKPDSIVYDEFEYEPDKNE